MTGAALAAFLALGVVATSAHADSRLDAFRSACIPYRASYEATWLKAKPRVPDDLQPWMRLEDGQLRPDPEVVERRYGADG